jgi:hypothetical protein
VIKSVHEKKFYVYSVNTIDEGISLLTDLEPGVMDETGAYPVGTINYLVNEKLKELAISYKEKRTDEPEEEKEK